MNQTDQHTTAVRTPEPMNERSERFQIRVRGMRKAFGDQPVLRGVDLDIERARINVIIGGSGAGKSVMMKHLIGLLKPDDGRIYVDGTDITGLKDVELNREREKFGMLFQYAALFDSMTVEENVMFPLVERARRGERMPRSRMKEMVREKLEALGLFNVEQKYPAELSGGMRKRVGLARAIVTAPEILFYDEPTTGLDPIATKNVDEMIADIAGKLGVTSVVISHDMASTFRIGHRVSMLYKGQIIASGTPDEILRHPHPELREFIQTSGAVQVLPPDADGPESAGRSR